MDSGWDTRRAKVSCTGHCQSPFNREFFSFSFDFFRGNMLVLCIGLACRNRRGDSDGGM